MTQDHDDIDYSAWEAPPAPDVTEAVIERAKRPVATAIETAPPKRSGRGRLLAVGAVAVSAAVLLVAVMIDRANQPPPAPSLADLRVEELEKKVDELEAAVERLNALGAEPPSEPAPAAAAPASATAAPPATAKTPPAPAAPSTADRPKACDAGQLIQRGKELYTAGNVRAALEHFEQSYACKASEEAAVLAAMAACRTQRRADAFRWYRKTPEKKRSQIRQICLSAGIDLQVE